MPYLLSILWIVIGLSIGLLYIILVYGDEGVYLLLLLILD